MPGSAAAHGPRKAMQGDLTLCPLPPPFGRLIWMTGLLITAFGGVEFGIIAAVAVSVALVSPPAA